MAFWDGVAARPWSRLVAAAADVGWSHLDIYIAFFVSKKNKR